MIPKNFYLVLLSTLDWDKDYPIYGNYKYYTGHKYKENFKELYNDLEKIRKDISSIVKQNHLFIPYVYTEIFESDAHYVIPTWNTRV